jgi:hypothetical protein
VAEDLNVFVNNVAQQPGSGKSYTATGTTLTFDAAPDAGTNNVYVVYRGLAEPTTRLEHPSGQPLAATTGTFSGAVTATSFAGDGSGLTGLGGGFPSGTKMLFGQTAAPTGWTKITSNNDAALRIVSGTVGTGGSVALSTALATPSVTGTISGSTGSHTLSTAEMPSHNHSYTQRTGSSTIKWDYFSNATNVTTSNSGSSTGSTGGGGSHNHSLSATFSSGTATINVKYVDVIMASKD